MILWFLYYCIKIKSPDLRKEKIAMKRNLANIATRFQTWLMTWIYFIVQKMLICWLDSCRVPRKYKNPMQGTKFFKLARKKSVTGTKIVHDSFADFTRLWLVLTTYPGCRVQIRYCAVRIQTRRVQRGHWPENLCCFLNQKAKDYLWFFMKISCENAAIFF